MLLFELVYQNTLHWYSHITKILAWNIMFFSALNNPKSPWYLNPFKAEFNKTYITAKLITIIINNFNISLFQGDQQLKGSFNFYLIKFALHCLPIFEHKICIETSVLQLKHQIDWDSATCITYSTDYHQRLTLESWFTNLEQTPLNRSQQLPAPYKQLIDKIK